MTSLRTLLNREYALVNVRPLVLIAAADVFAMATWFSASAVITSLASAFGIATVDQGLITSAVQFGFVTAAVASALVALAVLAVPLISMVALPPSYRHVGRFDVHALGTILSNRDVVLADAGYWGHMWELYAVWAWGPVFTRRV